MPDYHSGLVLITDNAGNVSIALNGEQGKILMGRNGMAGDLRIRDSNQQERIWLLGVSGDVIADKSIWVGPLLGPGVRALTFFGESSDLTIHHKNNVTNKVSRVFHFIGKSAHLKIGDKGNSGELVIYDDSKCEGFRATAKKASVRIGSNRNRGRFIICDENGVERFHLDGKGYIEIRDDAGNQTFGFNTIASTLVLGRQGNAGRVVLYGEGGAASIDIDGKSGDIKLHGADCAELFEVDNAEKIEPGTVMVIDSATKLVPCEKPYDRKVAGVVSGCGDLSPGVILACKDYKDNKLPVALNGKVYCKVDCFGESIEAGDLLTTSGKSGFAMKASDREKSFGAILGKALDSFKNGQGLVPVLVTLH